MRTSGLWAAGTAYVFWGLFPLYWKFLSAMPALQLLQFRIILTAIACIVLLPMRRSVMDFFQTWKEWRSVRLLGIAAILLSGNWLSFIWAVNNDRVLESSLGYFLCPLASVFLGMIFEKERLSRQQMLAVGIAAIGVLLLLSRATQFPLAAILIMFTWSGYGLIKKRVQQGPITSLAVETSLLSPFALMGICWLLWNGEIPHAYQSLDLQFWALLLLSGVFSSFPLVLFGFAMQRIPLNVMGMGQYIVHSLHFLLAILYGESVNAVTIIAFSFVWVSLAIFSMGTLKKAAD